jgi:outer membrane biosynthesis protein TonB
MLARRVAGEVVARFVVDTAGRVDPGSFRLVSATNPAFVHPVRTSVPRMRYAPAESAGRRIPQVVEQAFRFTPPD